MTIASMTGFARVAGEASDLSWVWELRSVNGRGLDLRVRLPNGFEALDRPLRKQAGRHLSRGNVQINFQLQRGRTNAKSRLNREWLYILLKTARALSRQSQFAPPRAESLLGLRGVIEATDETPEPVLDEAVQTAVLASADKAFSALVAARQEEGQSLHAILIGHLDTVERLSAAARNLAATQPQALKERFLYQLNDLLAEAPPLPGERIAQEVAVLAAKANVREELDRLDAHIVAGRALLTGNEPCGRKWEFLAQEFNREANTLCSKSQDIELTRIGLDLKATIDQVREQVANLE